MTRKKSPQPRYWFKRRRYGWGWIPSTWQGWLVVAWFVVILIGGSVLLVETPRNTFSVEAAQYLTLVGVAVIGLVVVSWAKGPRPKWRWGAKKTDNPREDF